MKGLWARSAPLLVAAAMVGFGSGIAVAACTDIAAPGVNWHRCYQDFEELVNVDLSGASLRDATFQRTRLDGSILTGVDAYHAKFIRASLVEVNLDEARLNGADFTNADLSGASLRSADLRDAKLVGTVLRHADLSQAQIRGADFRNADLSGAIWVDGQKVCRDPSIGECH